HFVGHVNPQSVALREDLVQGSARLEALQQFRTEPRRKVGGLNTQRSGVRDPHAPQENHLFTRTKVQGFRYLLIRTYAPERQNLGSRPRTAILHLFAERKKLPEIFL